MCARSLVPSPVKSPVSQLLRSPSAPGSCTQGVGTGVQSLPGPLLIRVSGESRPWLILMFTRSVRRSPLTSRVRHEPSTPSGRGMGCLSSVQWPSGCGVSASTTIKLPSSSTASRPVRPSPATSAASQGPIEPPPANLSPGGGTRRRLGSRPSRPAPRAGRSAPWSRAAGRVPRGSGGIPSCRCRRGWAGQCRSGQGPASRPPRSPGAEKRSPGIGECRQNLGGEGVRRALGTPWVFDAEESRPPRRDRFDQRAGERSTGFDVNEAGAAVARYIRRLPAGRRDHRPGGRVHGDQLRALPGEPIHQNGVRGTVTVSVAERGKLPVIFVARKMRQGYPKSWRTDQC